jgi:hypothetical protein
VQVHAEVHAFLQPGAGDLARLGGSLSLQGVRALLVGGGSVVVVVVVVVAVAEELFRVFDGPHRDGGAPTHGDTAAAAADVAADISAEPGFHHLVPPPQFADGRDAYPLQGVQDPLPKHRQNAAQHRLELKLRAHQQPFQMPLALVAFELDRAQIFPVHREPHFLGPSVRVIEFHRVDVAFELLGPRDRAELHRDRRGHPSQSRGDDVVHAGELGRLRTEKGYKV